MLMESLRCCFFLFVVFIFVGVSRRSDDAYLLFVEYFCFDSKEIIIRPTISGINWSQFNKNCWSSLEIL